jgi:hypothetical protein
VDQIYLYSIAIGVSPVYSVRCMRTAMGLRRAGYCYRCVDCCDDVVLEAGGSVQLCMDERTDLSFRRGYSSGTVNGTNYVRLQYADQTPWGDVC